MKPKNHTALIEKSDNSLTLKELRAFVISSRHQAFILPLLWIFSMALKTVPTLFLFINSRKKSKYSRNANH